MLIAKDKVVSIDYKLTNPEGEVIDTSEGREPLAYLHGSGNLIPGLESALEGKAAGEDLNVTVQPEHGYGERHDQLVQEVPRDMFQGVDELKVGMRFTADSEQGQRTVTITDVGDEQVTIDGNHPLAGVTLNFDVKIVEVRDATAEEKDHGHVHGPGGHQH